MIEFGKTLIAAREAKGYTVSQVAEITHLTPQVVAQLEAEDFSKIPAPIYGRGFIKLYCEAVGINPVALVAEFMDIYNGKRPPAIRLKPTATAPSATPAAPVAPVPPPAAAPAASPRPNSLFEEFAPKPAAVEPPPPTPPVPEPEPPAVELPKLQPPAPKLPEAEVPPPPMENPLGPLFAAHPESEADAVPPERASALNRAAHFAPPRRDFRLPDAALPKVPASVWRFALLAVGAIVIITLIFLGLRALTRLAMTPDPAAAAPETEEVTTESPRQIPATVDPKRSIKLDPLYL